MSGGAAHKLKPSPCWTYRTWYTLSPIPTVTPTPNSKLWCYPQDKLWTYSETWPQVPYLCNPAYHISDPWIPPLLLDMFSLLHFLFEHCFHITLLVIPCLPISDACLFCVTHVWVSQTSVQPLQTFLIRSQYLLDLESPLFSFCTDFELYK